MKLKQITKSMRVCMQCGIKNKQNNNNNACTYANNGKYI